MLETGYLNGHGSGGLDKHRPSHGSLTGRRRSHRRPRGRSSSAESSARLPRARIRSPTSSATSSLRRRAAAQPISGSARSRSPRRSSGMARITVRSASSSSAVFCGCAALRRLAAMTPRHAPSASGGHRVVNRGGGRRQPPRPCAIVAGRRPPFEVGDVATVSGWAGRGSRPVRAAKAQKSRSRQHRRARSMASGWLRLRHEPRRAAPAIAATVSAEGAPSSSSSSGSAVIAMSSEGIGRRVRLTSEK
jgi:hypothetical protein